MSTLYWSTVTPLLKSCLELLMDIPAFGHFRLVGGTALSLQLGHRMSDDIDLFSDMDYGKINFDELDGLLRKIFPYVDLPVAGAPAMGRSYFIGESKDKSIKLDLYYTDTFVWDMVLKEGVRMASIPEITAMKVDVIDRGGRMKDFWDLHELLGRYDISEMIALHAQRYPYSSDEKKIRKMFADFSAADDDFTPKCLNGKHWEFVKLDIIEAL